MSVAPEKRALILAGGGLKVAFQAGVLQAWLDKGKLEFGLADGASGGVFNLAMYCSGQTGTQIADHWRHTNPLELISLNPRPWASLLTLDAFENNVLGDWNITWGAMDPERANATFNVYNFTRQELRKLAPNEMNRQWLKACVSLPMWFPPIVIDGDVYVDAIYATDANIAAAIDKGADELWIIWTVSEKGRWRNGFVSQYFQIIENAANWQLKDMERRIARNNEAIEAGQPGEFGRHIGLKILRQEVPVHYLLVFNRDRLREAVELGVQRGWAFFEENRP